MHDFSYTSLIHDLIMDDGLFKEAANRRNKAIQLGWRVPGNGGLTPEAARLQKFLLYKGMTQQDLNNIYRQAQRDGKSFADFNNSMRARYATPAPATSPVTPPATTKTPMNVAADVAETTSQQTARTAKPGMWSRASGALKRNPKLAAILGGVGFLGGGLGTYAWLRPKTKKKPLPDPNLTYTVPKYMI